jgi:predicted ATPase
MVVGDVVNTAARLQSHAPVNGIVVGEETYVSTRGAIEYHPGDPVIARGKAEPIPVWFAVGALTSAGERTLSRAPMVGRTRELELLRGIWDRVVAERRGHLVTIFGPPGIGKSRLAWEFSELVPGLGGRMLRGRSAPYGTSEPYAAFATHLKQIAGIFDSDPGDVAAAKLKAAVTGLVGESEEPQVTAHVASLVALRTGSEAPDRPTLFLSARKVVEQLAAQQPLLLVFEDVQWAEDSMLDLLDELAALLQDSPVLLLAVARPDLLTERPTWGGGLPAYTALKLEPLRAEHAQELAERLLGPTEEDRIARLLEISEGNPLFIEELSAALVERPEARELPTTIRALIASRLDALPTPERTLMLDASVVGRVFWDGSIPGDDGRDVRTILGSLERRDLVRRESPSRLQGHEQYRFKHSLIRSVAYQLLPRTARRTRHEAVARFLEQATGEARGASEALAHHWQEAGDAERAVEYLVAAGDDAGRGWAKEHAVALYREALSLLPEGHAERRAVQLRLAVALQTVYHVRDAQRLRRG